MERSQGVGGNSFVETLTQLRKGMTVAELSLELAELVSAVKKTGKKGVLTFKLVVSPSGEEIVSVEDVIEVKCPKMPRKSTVFYTTEDHRLQRNDPNQAELELKMMEGGKNKVTVDGVAAVMAALAQ